MLSGEAWETLEAVKGRLYDCLTVCAADAMKDTDLMFCRGHETHTSCSVEATHLMFCRGSEGHIPHVLSRQRRTHTSCSVEAMKDTDLMFCRGHETHTSCSVEAMRHIPHVLSHKSTNARPYRETSTLL